MVTEGKTQHLLEKVFFFTHPLLLLSHAVFNCLIPRFNGIEWMGTLICMEGRRAYWLNESPVVEHDPGLMVGGCLMLLFSPDPGYLQNSLLPMSIYSCRGKAHVINVVYKLDMYQWLLWARCVNSQSPCFLVWKIIHAHGKNKCTYF